VQIPDDQAETSFIISLLQNSSSHSNDLDSFEFKVQNQPTQGGAFPKLLTRYLELLSGKISILFCIKNLLDRSINENVLQAAIKSTRSEWLNHSKLLFQLSRQREQIDLDQVAKIIRCGPQVSSLYGYFNLLTF
jgi:hypothetical protein